MNKESIIDLLLSEPIGMIAACNIIDGVENESISIDVVKELLNRWLRKCCDNKHDSVDEMIGVIGNIACQIKKGSSNNFFCCGQAHESTTLDQLLHITNYRVLIQFIVDKKTVFSMGEQSITPLPPSNSTVTSRSFRRLIENDGLRRYGVNGKFDGSIGQLNRVFWATQRSEIQECLDLVSIERADRVRDKLGLIHWPAEKKASSELIVIEMPKQNIEVQRACPSFIDASAHRRFRSHVGEQSKIKTDRWGMTVDLNKLRKKNSNLDGARECVVRTLSTTKLSDIQFMPIGFVNNKDHTEDVDYVNILLRNRNKNHIKSQILNLL